MNTLSTHSRTYASLDIDSNVFVTVNNIGIQMKADGKHVVFSGNVLRALLSLNKNNAMIGAVSKMINAADLVLHHVDINICLYNKRFAVMGPETKPAVNWVKSFIVRYLKRK